MCMCLVVMKHLLPMFFDSAVVATDDTILILTRIVQTDISVMFHYYSQLELCYCSSKYQ